MMSLEARIGARWLLYIGVVAIVMGVAYFEKMAFENHWVGEVARAVQGGVFGLLMVYAGIRFARNEYRLYGQVISGCGLVVLYISTYAAFTLYALVSRPVAFALMCATTMLAAWLADRHRSPGLALVAIAGGFATPFLLPTAVDPQVALLSYDAVLIAGTVFLARRHEWPALNVVSYASTVATFISWAGEFYTPAQYPTTEVFLTLYCAMFLVIVREMRRREAAPSAEQMVLLTVPIAYYVGSILNLFEHAVPLLMFLIAFSTASVIASRRAGAELRLLCWMAAAAPLMLWADGHATISWLSAGLATIAAVYVIFLFGHLERTRPADKALAPADIILVHVNGLWMFGCAYLMLEPTSLSTAAAVAAGFAVWHAAVAWMLRTVHRNHALHFMAVAFTLLMIAVALQFDGPWITVGWAAEGAVVVLVGLRERREWLRVGGFVLIAIAIGRLLNLLFSSPRVDQMLLLNRRAACAAFVIASTYWIAWMHRVGQDPPRSVEVAAAVVTAQALTLALLTSEILSYWDVHFVDRLSVFAREMSLSLTWAGFATALVVVGTRRAYAPIRYFAIGVFALTVAKVFALDLAQLNQLYRISSIVGLGVMLLTSSYLYQHFGAESPADDVER